MSFGKRVRELREEKGLSRQELANALNITYAALSKYETNDRFPSEDILTRVADYFDVSIDELVGRVYFKKDVDKYNEKIAKHLETAREISKLEEDDQEFILQMIQKLKKNKEDK